MARYIDADALREAWLCNGENENIYSTNDFLGSIDAQPTVDAAPMLISVKDGGGMPLITSEKMEIISEAIAYYGESKQIDMAIEEMSELIKALCKSKRASAGDARQAAHANTTEEIADVFIMLVQMIKIFDCADDVQNTVDQKIDRLKKRMQEQKEVGTDEANEQNRKADC
jgi:NTP pyrophosphatase (non-canonical NTP hydrolase)